MQQVKDKVAFITGALGGIGQAYARALLKNGLKGVALIDISEQQAEKFQKELAKEFGPNQSIFIKTDLREKRQIKDALEKTIAHFKQLDIVINNAGIMKEDSIEDTMNINLIATLIITELALKTYLPKYQKGTGVIVNTASEAGIMAVEMAPLYAVSKHAVVSMSVMYGTETNFEKYKVKIYTICPGATESPLLDFAIEKMDLKLPTENRQSAAAVGNCLLEALKSEKNGSVWVSQSNKSVEFDYAALQSIGEKFVQDLCPNKNVISK